MSGMDGRHGMRAPWLAQYRNVDDDALAALTSTGLLRRAAKDVEAGKVTAAHGGDGASLALLVDGQQVALGPAGPAAARCDCPAPGICKHVLAAVLWLRTQAEPDGETAAPDVLAEVLALDPATVFKAAGRPAVRKAAALAGTAGPAGIDIQGGVLRVALPELQLLCRYVAGGGFAGMVSEAAPASRTALHLLALAAVWAAHGVPVPWPEAAPAAPGPAGLVDGERRFLADVRTLMLELGRTGWAHLSDFAPMQLRTLGMSARIEAFPRLAGMLATLAGTAALLYRRDVVADEREAIGLAARIHALCLALGNAPTDALPALRGVARRSFDGGASLELLPLGAWWWQGRGGARGLSVPFWDAARRGIVMAVLARHEHDGAADHGFDRNTAWAGHPLWRHAGSAGTLAGNSWKLDDARLSSDGRIGIGGTTSAAALPAWTPDDPRWLEAGFDDWHALRSALGAAVGLACDPVDAVLLRPASHGRPQLDEARQRVGWMLVDGGARALRLELPCDAETRARIGNLDAWIGSGVRIAGVVAAVARDAGRLEPVTLLIEADGRLRAVSLDYEAPPRDAGSGLAARLARLLRDAVAVPSAPALAASGHARCIGGLLAILEHHCMSGRHALTAHERQQVAAARRFLHATGLDLLVAMLDAWSGAPSPEQALVLVHACRTVLELDYLSTYTGSV